MDARLVSAGRRARAAALALGWLLSICVYSACGGPRSPQPPAPAHGVTGVATLEAPSTPPDAGVDASIAVAVAELEAGTPEEPVAEAADAGPFAWLPAITDDGRKVAFAKTEVTGPQVTPYLAVATKDVAHDRPGPLYVIHGGEEPEKPGHDARVAAALHALGRDRWKPLTQYDVHEDPGAPERQGGLGSAFRANMAEGEGLTVRYREPLLTVTDEKGRELVHRNMPTYSRTGGMMCKGCVDCPPWLAHLRDVHGARAKGVVLLEIEYRGGTDVCWEPPPVVHVVTF